MSPWRAVAVVPPLLAVLLASASPALATQRTFGAHIPVPAVVDVAVPVGVKAGQDINVNAVLTTSGFPIVGADLQFSIDGSAPRTVQTDALGTAHLVQRGVLPAGPHDLLVFYLGDHNSYDFYQPVAASGTGRFVVDAIVVSVHILPVLPGVILSLDGQQGSVSDADGLALLGVSTAGVHQVAVSLPPDGDAMRFSFVRWSDESFSASRPLRIDRDLSIGVGLRVAYLTPIVFADLDGNTLNSARVSNVVLSGPDGEVVRMGYPYVPVWLQTPLPVKHIGDSGLYMTPAPYALSSAGYDDLNVASRGLVRYTPTPGGTWVIRLLLYRLTLRSKDALFGTELREAISITNPAGRRQVLKPDLHGEVSIIAGRGSYTAHVLAAGISPTAPIALSRSQTAVVPVITPLDLIVIVLSFLLSLATIFVVGRGRGLALNRLRLIVPRVGSNAVAQAPVEIALEPKPIAQHKTPAGTAQPKTARKRTTQSESEKLRKRKTDSKAAREAKKPAKATAAPRNTARSRHRRS